MLGIENIFLQWEENYKIIIIIYLKYKILNFTKETKYLWEQNLWNENIMIFLEHNGWNSRVIYEICNYILYYGMTYVIIYCACYFRTKEMNTNIEKKEQLIIGFCFFLKGLRA